VESNALKHGISFLKMLGIYSLKGHTESVISIAEKDQQSAEIRLAAAEAVVGLGQEKRMLPLLARFIIHPSLTKSQKTQAIDLVARMRIHDAGRTLANAFTSADAQLQNELALALCRTSAGSEALLQEIVAGKASARILQDKKVNERFMLKASDESKGRAGALLESLPPADQELAKKILALRASFLQASASESRGRSVFQKNCAACHRIGSEGATVGPQLDGIGRRGVERLLEDILDPNRNVDAAFSTINIATKEGDIFSGLKVSDDAQAIELVDSQAKKHRIPRNEIEEVKPSRLSPMPSGLARVMKQEEIHDLLAYLLSTSGPTE
ncbi:MAG: c-type cytochrome, partial [Planctomycetota bacterium]|nr:c-type cytochrome [Planctomycetota bacterium]